MTFAPGVRAAAALAILILYAALRGRGGLRYAWRSAGSHATVAIAALAGFALVAAPVALLSGLASWSPAPLPAWELILLAAEILLLTALPQEMLFRGLLFAWLQQRMRGRWGPWPALALSSVIFSLAHAPLTTDPVYLLLAAAAGMAYGWCFLRTGSLAPGAMVHTAVNLLHHLVLTSTSGP